MKDINNIVIKENETNEKDSLPRVFYDIENSLRNIHITDKESAIDFFNLLYGFGQQISDNFFDEMEETNKTDKIEIILQSFQKEKNISPNQGEENNDNDNNYEKENKGNGSLSDYLFHVRENISYGIRTFGASPKGVETPISGQEIWISNVGSDTKGPFISDTLENIFTQDNTELERELLLALEESKTKIANKILYAIDQETHIKKTWLQQARQDVLEKEVNTKIIKLLSQENDTPGANLTEKDSLANYEDFKEGFADVHSIIKNTYAENAEFFNNIFLGFDIAKGGFQTRKDKETQYNEIFHEKKDGEPEHRNILGLGSTNNLPIIAKSISTDILQNLSTHTRPLIQRSPEEEVMHHIKEYLDLQYYGLQPDELAKIYKIALTRRYKAENEEQKKTALSKTYEQIRNILSHRKYRISISGDMPANAKSQIIENIAAIHPDYKDCFGRITTTGQEKIDAMPDIWKEAIKNVHKAANDKKKEIGYATFGPDFDLEKIYEDRQFQQDLKFYGEIGHGNRAIGMAIKYKLNQKDIKLDKTLAFLKQLKKVEKEKNIQIETITERYFFMDDIQKLLGTEKDILQNFGATFERTEASIEEILTKFITKKFKTHIIGDKFNLAKRIIDLIKKFTIVIKLEKLDNTIIHKTLENIQGEINDIILFEEFQYIIKAIKITPTYTTQHRQKVFQKELDYFQYNRTGNFGLYEINKIEDIKRYAQELGIQLQTPKHPPLEEFYIHRLRTPEGFDNKSVNENFYDRYEGTIGYNDRNLASIDNIEHFLKETGSKITRSDVLDMDIRSYRNIDEKDWFDMKEIVPVALHFPKVEVCGYGNYDEKGQMQGYYVLAFDNDKMLFSLIFDSTLIHGDMIIQKYNLTRENMTIMGGGRLEVDKNNTTLLIKDKIDTYHHEPRIITLTALYNAFKNQQLDYKIFIGKDGFIKFGDYF